MLGLAVLSASISSAQTPPKVSFGSQPASFVGLAPEGAKISAIFIFTPDQKSLAQNKCKFADDDTNPNGKDHVLTAVTKSVDGRYELNYSMTAARGQCQYIVSEIYLTLQTPKVYETMTIVPQAFAPKADELVAGIKDATPMYCEFSSPDMGLCEIEKSSMTYSFAPSDQKITLDFKDVSEKPVIPDSDVQ